MVMFQHVCRLVETITKAARSGPVFCRPAVAHLGVAGLVMGLVGSQVFFAGGCVSDDSTERLEEARAAIARQDFELAKTNAQAIPAGDAKWGDAQLLLGGIEQAFGRQDAARRYYETIPRDGTAESLAAAEALADIHYGKCSLADAMDCLEYVLQHRPDDVKTHTQLALLYAGSGLRGRAQAHLMLAVKKGDLAVKNLVMLTVPERRGDHGDFLRQCAAANAGDPFINLGLAIEDFEDQNFGEAKRRVSLAVGARPHLAEAQALLGELSLDGELTEVESWYAHLPPEARDDAEIWFVRGLWARRIHQNQVAARCFLETIRQNPIHRRAMFQLGQVLLPLDPPLGEAFAERAAQLKECAERTERMLIRKSQDRENFQRLIALLIGMGREWEAWAWTSVAREMVGQSDWLARLAESLAYVPKSNPPRFKSDKNLALRHPLSDYPVFDSLRWGQTAGGRAPSPTRPAALRFEDQAGALGVDFTYFQSPDMTSHTVRIFESTGGGVGVLDFDNDGWPDFYLTQGQEWPRGQEHPVPAGAYHDRLYRNCGNRFHDVTAQAGLETDEGYGQGISCGDFNNDGFADVYVANIGGNRLLMNNGDGTLSDVTRKAGISGAAWTTSCLILDLNADGNPDLFDVNYLQGENIFSVECEANRCSVRGYQGAPDRVQLSRGDGTFFEVPDATPQSSANVSASEIGQGIGKGLGIVALFINGEQRPSLFIANDQVPNFFLRPATGDGRFSDQAALCGLAVNRDGQTTASMGVAAGDLNHDRLIDLFVTNFEGEAKTLFVQRAPGLFEDSIMGSGLMAAGIPYVGWGTQFLDADNDGELDLVVTNGHVADFKQPGITYRMPTQFFRNAGQGRFVQQSPGELGELFERRLLGRAIATLDWNRDGRTDFILSNIESPAAVATNLTGNAGHWLDVRLHACVLARDAIGAQVEIRCGEAVHWQQLLAGDGYQASNERTLHFGLSQAEAIDELLVHWPGGGESRFAAVPVDSVIEVVEGSPKVGLWHDPQVSSQPTP